MDLSDLLAPAPPKVDGRTFNTGRPVGSGLGPTGPQDFTQRGRGQITHDMIIDFIIANPRATYEEIAAEFSYSRGGVAVLCNSDAFKARYEKRKSDIVDPLIIQRIEDRLNGLAVQSMDILARKLETSDDGGFALKVLETTTRANGYGVAKPQAINTQFVVHLPGPASSSAEWSSKFSTPGAAVLRAIPDDIPSEEGGA